MKQLLGVGSPKRIVRSGFTIVELLIVVVVIAILAAITVVGYNGITSQAKTAELKSNYRAISQAVEAYKSEHGSWPLCDTGNNSYSQCNVTELAPKLAFNGLPTRTGKNNTLYINYVVQNSTERWAISMRKGDNTLCKVGVNIIETWYESAPPCW